MREIKFRAADTVTGEMLYPEEGHNLCVSAIGVPCIDFTDDGGKLEGWGHRLKVMRYTGLKDNTEWKDLTEEQKESWRDRGGTKENWEGKDIYENDLLGYFSQSYLDHLSDLPMKWHVKEIIWNEEELCWWVGDLENGFKPNMKQDNRKFKIVGRS